VEHVSSPAERARNGCEIWRSEPRECLDGLLTYGRPSGSNPDGHRSGSLREVGFTGDDRDCSRLKGKPEVIRKRTLDSIGGFQPARRDVVQKSASRTSPLISPKSVMDSFRFADKPGVGDTERSRNGSITHQLMKRQFSPTDVRGSRSRYRLFYSVLSACMGSTDAARRAGSQAANDEQMKSKMIVPTMTRASSGFTS
jgi:hypothetical protein